MGKFNLILAAVLALALFPARALAVDPTWNYAVEVSATVSSAPPWIIVLSWPEDTAARYGYAPAYTIYRRHAGKEDWGDGVALHAGQTAFADNQVEPGVRYEYRIVREFRHPHAPQENHDGYGYILTGIDIPPVHSRGRAILVVEQRVAQELADHVAAFRRNLIGDGWTVSQLEVATDAAPAEVQRLIRERAAEPEADAGAVILLGRVPVARAGRYAPDGHEPRALPADAFYGDLDGEWKDEDGDGIYDGNVIASDIELQVGRIDFAEMDGVGADRTELELLARYLEKNHAFRHAVVRPPRRALIGDRVGIDRGRAPAASGYRAFATFFGPENVHRANVEDHGPEEERWISLLTAEPYLWAFGSGGGGDSAISFLGLRDTYKSASSADLAAGAKGTFYLLFGSYFVDWSKPNNLMRAALAAPTYGLAAAWAGRPSLYFHHMGLGETIGHGIRLSQNNDGFYYSPGFPNSWRRHVHVALMGDPTLRLDPVAPARELAGVRNGPAVRLEWHPSPDVEREQGNGSVLYYVYRATSAEGPFALLTPDAIAETSLVDVESPEGAVYMVRASKRQRTSSGTYWNLSQGVFWRE